MAATSMHAAPTPRPTPNLTLSPLLLDDAGGIALEDVEVPVLVIVGLLVLLVDIVALVLVLVLVLVLDTPTVAAIATRTTFDAQQAVEFKSPPQHHVPSATHRDTAAVPLDEPPLCFESSALCSISLQVQDAYSLIRANVLQTIGAAPSRVRTRLTPVLATCRVTAEARSCTRIVT
jgi:hypothetical protein